SSQTLNVVKGKYAYDSYSMFRKAHPLWFGLPAISNRTPPNTSGAVDGLNCALAFSRLCASPSRRSAGAFPGMYRGRNAVVSCGSGTTSQGPADETSDGTSKSPVCTPSLVQAFRATARCFGSCSSINCGRGSVPPRDDT